MEIKKWTEQDNMKLLDMAAAGMAQKDLAAHYSTTVGNISWRLKHLRDKMKPTDTDAKIAEICEIPDPPKKKIDYTDSLLETLREAIELHEPVYFVTDSQEPPKPEPKPRALFTELHSVLYTAEATAKRNGMTATRLSVDVDGGKIHIRAWDETDNEIYICKKYQPVTEEKQ